jgi:hypothetical protein
MPQLSNQLQNNSERKVILLTLRRGGRHIEVVPLCPLQAAGPNQNLRAPNLIRPPARPPTHASRPSPATYPPREHGINRRNKTSKEYRKTNRRNKVPKNPGALGETTCHSDSGSDTKSQARSRAQWSRSGHKKHLMGPVWHQGSPQLL